MGRCLARADRSLTGPKLVHDDRPPLVQRSAGATAQGVSVGRHRVDAAQPTAPVFEDAVEGVVGDGAEGPEAAAVRFRDGSRLATRRSSAVTWPALYAG